MNSDGQAVWYGFVDGLDAEIFLYDTNHFITEEFDSQGKIYGFNQVFPKTSGQLLITTSGGDPVLTIRRFGLGRVAAISTDDGTRWASDLVRPQNSAFFVRTLTVHPSSLSTA